jgi:hypothetical protein
MPDATTAPVLPASTAPLVDAYKSPYTTDVLGSALTQLNKAGQQRRNQLGSEAFSAGAYGDARHGVEGAQLTDDLTRAAGDLTASVNADSWDKAMGWLNTDLDRQTSTAFNNAALDQGWYDRQLAGLTTASNLENTALTNGKSMVDAWLGLDQYDRGQTQDQLNVDYDTWLEKTGYDKKQLSDYLSLISGTPAQSSEENSNAWLSSLAASLGGINFGSGSGSTASGTAASRGASIWG